MVNSCTLEPSFSVTSAREGGAPPQGASLWSLGPGHLSFSLCLGTRFPEIAAHFHPSILAPMLAHPCVQVIYQISLPDGENSGQTSWGKGQMTVLLPRIRRQPCLWRKQWHLPASSQLLYWSQQIQAKSHQMLLEGQRYLVLVVLGSLLTGSSGRPANGHWCVQWFLGKEVANTIFSGQIIQFDEVFG